MGAGISVNAAPQARITGGGITVTKFLVAVARRLSVETLFGPEGRWGLSSVAVIAAMENSNGGLHTVLSGAAVTPAPLAQADPALPCIVAAATPLIVTSVIVTALLTPMLTFLGGKR